MSDERDGLDPDVLALLRAAMPIEDPPDDARARMASAVEARIAALGPGGGGPPGSAGPAGPAGSSAPGAAGPAALRGAWVGAHPWLALSGVLALGGALGALAHGAASPPRVVYVDRVVTVAAPVAPPSAAPPAVVETPAAPSSIAATPPPIPSGAASAAPAKAAPADAGQQLKAESALLNLARTALARGEGAPALAAVERHAAQFPRGMLREEREALAVKALVLAGRGADARARGDQFRERYPESLFRPAVDASTRSIP